MQILMQVEGKASVHGRHKLRRFLHSCPAITSFARRDEGYLCRLTGDWPAVARAMATQGFRLLPASPSPSPPLPRRSLGVAAAVTICVLGLSVLPWGWPHIFSRGQLPAMLLLAQAFATLILVGMARPLFSVGIRRLLRLHPGLDTLLVLSIGVPLVSALIQTWQFCLTGGAPPHRSFAAICLALLLSLAARQLEQRQFPAPNFPAPRPPVPENETPPPAPVRQAQNSTRGKKRRETAVQVCVLPSVRPAAWGIFPRQTRSHSVPCSLRNAAGTLRGVRVLSGEKTILLQLACILAITAAVAAGTLWLVCSGQISLALEAIVSVFAAANPCALLFVRPLVQRYAAPDRTEPSSSKQQALTASALPHTDAAAALAGCTAAPSQRAHKTIAAGRNVNAISRRQSQARAVAKGSLHLAVGSTVLDLLVVVLFLPPLAAAPLPLMVPILTQSACILLLWCNARRLRA